MAGRVELKGVIGYDNMAPKKIVQSKDRSYMFFKMWADNYAKKRLENDNGSMRFQRDAVQVILPETKHGYKLFEILTSGRKVLVRGRQTHRPNIGTNRNGEQVAYANPTVYLESLDFLDEPPKSAANRVLQVLCSECGAINDDQFQTLKAAFDNYQDGLKSETTITQQGSDEPEDPADPFDN